MWPGYVKGRRGTTGCDTRSSHFNFLSWACGPRGIPQRFLTQDLSHRGVAGTVRSSLGNQALHWVLLPLCCRFFTGEGRDDNPS